MTVGQAIAWRFDEGDRVAVRQQNGTYRMATVLSRAGYLSAEGYYVAWELPADAPPWVERGGWKPGTSIIAVPTGVDRV